MIIETIPGISKFCMTGPNWLKVASLAKIDTIPVVRLRVHVCVYCFQGSFLFLSVWNLSEGHWWDLTTWYKLVRHRTLRYFKLYFFMYLHCFHGDSFENVFCFFLPQVVSVVAALKTFPLCVCVCVCNGHSFFNPFEIYLMITGWI